MKREASKSLEYALLVAFLVVGFFGLMTFVSYSDFVEFGPGGSFGQRTTTQPSSGQCSEDRDCYVGNICMGPRICDSGTCRYRNNPGDQNGLVCGGGESNRAFCDDGICQLPCEQTGNCVPPAMYTSQCVGRIPGQVGPSFSCLDGRCSYTLTEGVVCNSGKGSCTNGMCITSCSSDRECNGQISNSGSEQCTVSYQCRNRVCVPKTIRKDGTDCNLGGTQGSCLAGLCNVRIPAL